jgi:hypothetical protein
VNSRATELAAASIPNRGEGRRMQTEIVQLVAGSTNPAVVIPRARGATQRCSRAKAIGLADVNYAVLTASRGSCRPTD